MAELTFTDENFEEEVLKSPDPVLVDFWAPWCGPCQQQGPVIDALAEEMSDKAVKIGKLNVDEYNQTPGNYGVMSIPALLIFKDGKVIEQLTGFHTKEVLAEKLNGLIS